MATERVQQPRSAGAAGPIVSSFPNRDGTVLAAGGQHTAALASMPRDGQDRLLVALEYLKYLKYLENLEY